MDGRQRRIPGTLRNPADYVEETGFYHVASVKVKDMLMFKELDRKIEERKIKNQF